MIIYDLYYCSVCNRFYQVFLVLEKVDDNDIEIIRCIKTLVEMNYVIKFGM